MAEFIDISGWNVKEWVNTTGTREKCFIENPENAKLYFFKKSIDKYPSEFWSEIIASKFGKLLKLDIVDYNIAELDKTCGCICESMIDQETQELDHGINIIKSAIPKFVVTERPEISFNQIEKALSRYRDYIKKFIDVMIFDALIGNQDRHSENWAIIRSLDIENKEFSKQRLLKFLMVKYKQSGLKFRNIPFKNFILKHMDELSLVDYRFSPIYDSGSSLGREITEETIPNYLSNESKILKYIRKGKSDIRWEGERISHFDLLKNIKNKYNEYFKVSSTKILNSYNKVELKSIVNNIDRNLPQEFEESKLSLSRKEWIFTLIDKRTQTLLELNN
jgi:hypothetical protein